MSFNIREFDVSTISPGAIVGVVGRRGSGKSIIIKDLLYSKRDVLPFGMVMSGTEAGNGYFGKFIPEVFVYDDFDGASLEKLLERQKTLSADRWNPTQSIYLLMKNLQLILIY